MANKETVNKVKSLLEGHVYGPLKDAAEKWLEVADEKYDIKDKAGQAWDKLGDAADKLSDATEGFNDKMAGLSDKVADAYDKAVEKAGPAAEKLGDAAERFAESSGAFNEKMAGLSGKVADAYDKAAEKAAPVAGKIAEKAAPAAEKLAEKAAPAAEKLAELELIKQLKEGINNVGDMLAHLNTKEAEEKWGEEAVAQMKAHVEDLKARGEKFCDCDACRKAREILKDFGEDIESKEEALKAFEDDAAEAAEDKAE